MPAELAGVDLRKATWMPRAVRLTRGATRWITVPAGDASRLLVGVVRLVADLPRGSTPDVVWTAGGSELLVHTDRTTLTCSAGSVSVGLLVSCDQLDGPASVTVPFATGTADDPRGLFLATVDRPAGPAVVVDVWSEALTAFAWESLLTLATELSAAAGKDAAGRPLVPAALGAADQALLVLPMVRNG